MKFLLKILFAPVIVVLTLIIWLFALVLRLSAWVFGILGTTFGILGLAILVLDNMTNGIIAEAFEMDQEDLKRRRAQSVRNVRATNGTISLEKYARSRQEPDWDDDEWQD